VGNIGFRNATSGTTTLAPATGALGTGTVTLPLSGTLATLAGAEALSNKTITASSFSGTTVAASTSVLIGTATLGVLGARVDQNAVTYGALLNATSGTAARAGFYVGTDATLVNAVGTVAHSAGFATSGIQVANTGAVFSAMPAGLNVGTSGATQTSLWTNNLSRLAIDSAGAVSIAQTLAVTGASTLTGLLTANGGITLGDGQNIAFNTTTGTKIGATTSQKLSFWNATPIVQPTTAVASATVAHTGGGTNIKTDDTFDGYTIAQVVKALRNAGLLA
jgi:hypothetical protein